MNKDAKFEDGAEIPIRLKALGPEDIPVISTLIQDSVLPSSEISWLPKENRFGLLLNRFRWENKSQSPERVQTVLVFDNVLSAKTNGIDSSNKDQILSILSLGFEAGDDASGTFNIILAGDGEIALQVECIDVTLQDATRPYISPSKIVPSHNLD